MGIHLEDGIYRTHDIRESIMTVATLKESYPENSLGLSHDVTYVGEINNDASLFLIAITMVEVPTYMLNIYKRTIIEKTTIETIILDTFLDI